MGEMLMNHSESRGGLLRWLELEHRAYEGG